MKKSNDTEWLDTFKADLKTLEDVHNVRVPEQTELLNTLNEFKERRKKIFLRELVAFFLTAIVIFTTYVVIAFKLTSVFILVQFVALFVIPLLLFIERKRRKSEDEVFSRGIR